MKKENPTKITSVAQSANEITMRMVLERLDSIEKRLEEISQRQLPPSVPGTGRRFPDEQFWVWPPQPLMCCVRSQEPTSVRY